VRRFSSLLIALAVTVAVAPAAARCQGAGNGFVAIHACADGSGLQTDVHAGAYDYGNAVSAGPGGLTVTNVPWAADRMTLGPSGPQLIDSELIGPTPIDSSLGSGGLTAGFTPEGTLAVFSWPGPSTVNQMQYLTTNRPQPRGGAAENQGAFAGLDYRRRDGARAFAWLREWPSTQRYAGGSSDALVTTYSHGSISVTQTAAVSPAADVMAIRYEVRGARDARIVFFENLNPALHKVPWLPGHDNFLWPASDFAALWERDAVVHFRPASVDPGTFLNLVEGSPDHLGQTLASDIADEKNPGVAIAITSVPRPTGHQIGVDVAGLVREGAPAVGGEDAYYDASARGARLSGSAAAAGQVDTAIAAPLQPGAGGALVADIVMAAGRTNDRAATLALSARYPSIVAAEEAHWTTWLASAALPDSANVDVDRRALIAIANGQTTATGSIVASIARQSPYAEDWVRDGAFLNYALDLAGHPEMVEQHNLFYARAQRPNGTWATMYYADGEEGGPFLYESDQQGFGAWTLWQHYVTARALQPGRNVKPYLDAVYPALRRSADWMKLYADPFNGRQGPGMEDDSFFPSSGLQGAVTQWMGLVSAVAAASIEHDPASAARWAKRAAALKASILSQYWDAKGVFHPGSEGFGQHLGYQGDFGAAAWVLWPAGLLDPNVGRERRMLQTLAAYLYDQLAARIPAAQILSYEQKGIGALAVYLGMGMTLPGGRDPSRVAAWVDLYHTALPTPTLHFGEQIWQVAPGEWADRVDMPHIWSGALVYLDAISLTRPALTPYRPWKP
jgi:hypothetical protein